MHRYQNKRQRREAELDEKIARLQAEEDLLAQDPSVGAVPGESSLRFRFRIMAVDCSILVLYTGAVCLVSY